MVPIEPTMRPLYLAPWAWAQSSTTGSPCFSASAMMGSMSAGSPAMCATTMALVRSDSTASISAAPALKVPGAASATTGMRLSSATGMTPPGSVMGGTTTSEPAGRLSAPTAQ